MSRFIFTNEGRVICKECEEYVRKAEYYDISVAEGEITTDDPFKSEFYCDCDVYDEFEEKQLMEEVEANA